MTLFDQIQNDVEDLDYESRDVLEQALNILEDYDGAIHKRDQVSVAAANQNIALLYQNEEIDPSHAETIEKQADAHLESAGHEPYFENLPDDQRPSQMYKSRDPWTTRRKLLAGIGAGIVATDIANLYDGDESGEGGLVLGPFDLDFFGRLESDTTNTPEQPPANVDPEPEEPDLTTGRRYEWSDVSECLTDEGKEGFRQVSSEYGVDRDEMRYSIESDGDVVFHIPYIEEGETQYRAEGQIDGSLDFSECEVNS